MNHLDDEVRAALHSPPSFAARPLDLEHIMAAGGRLRRRRRFAASGAAAAALAVVAFGATHLPVGADRSVDPPAASASPVPATTATSPPPLPAAKNGRIGDIVDTGLVAGAGRRWAVYFTPFSWPGNPGSTFGVNIGLLDARGTLSGTGEELAETEGSDRAAGFHTLKAPKALDGGLLQPAFGYYAGNPAKITAKFDGRTLTAHTAAWSVDPAVTAFWFDPADGATATTIMAEPRAFDLTGHPLPDGNRGIVPN
jgi:hypothetical protein